jgi:hypothetical protein
MCASSTINDKKQMYRSGTTSGVSADDVVWRRTIFVRLCSLSSVISVRLGSSTPLAVLWSWPARLSPWSGYLRDGTQFMKTEVSVHTMIARASRKQCHLSNTFNVHQPGPLCVEQRRPLEIARHSTDLTATTRPPHDLAGRSRALIQGPR